MYIKNVILLTPDPDDGGNASGHLSESGLATLFRKESPEGDEGADTPDDPEEPVEPESPSEDGDQGSEQPDDSDSEDGQPEEEEPNDDGEQPEEGEEPDADGDDGEPKTVAKLQKRIHQLADQRDAERNQRIELERRLEEVERRLNHDDQTPGPPQHPASAGMAGYQQQQAPTEEIAKLDRDIAWYNEFRDWARENPDGGTFQPSGGKPIEVAPEQVDSFSKEVDRSLPQLHADRTIKIHQYQTTLQAKAQESHNKAIRLYPWLENRESAEFKEALGIIRQHPHLLQDPEHELLVGRMVEGSKAERAKGKGKGALKRSGSRRSTPSPEGEPPAPVVVRPASSAARRRASNDADDDVSEAAQRFSSSGRVTDLKNMLASSHRARRTARAS